MNQFILDMSTMKIKSITQALGDCIMYHLRQELLRVKRNLAMFISGNRNKPGHYPALSEKEYLRIYHRKMKLNPKERNGIPETEALIQG